jgi:hypothetical protein
MSEQRSPAVPVDSGREAGDGRPAEVERRERRETTRGRAAGRSGLGLFGVTFSEGNVRTSPVSGVELIVVRELAAIVAAGPYAAQEPTEERVRHSAEVVTAFATQGPVLPAPVGVVFRSRDAVVRWLELHYVALSDALSFVDDRVVGRVHVYRPGKPSDEETGSDLAAVAADTMRELRRSAVATVPLRVEQITGIVLSAAFLIEQELWKDFASKVEEQGARVPNIRLELTGPWPPYDFVQMQFGS